MHILHHLNGNKCQIDCLTPITQEINPYLHIVAFQIKLSQFGKLLHKCCRRQKISRNIEFDEVRQAEVARDILEVVVWKVKDGQRGHLLEYGGVKIV